MRRHIGKVIILEQPDSVFANRTFLCFDIHSKSSIYFMFVPYSQTANRLFSCTDVNFPHFRAQRKRHDSVLFRISRAKLCHFFYLSRTFEIAIYRFYQITSSFKCC